jgi:hypothetical protein
VDRLKSSRTHLPSLLSGILFSLSGLLLLGIGLLMGFTALFSSFNGQAVQAQQTIFFIAFGFEAILLFVAAFFAFQKMLEKPAADQAAFLAIPLWQIMVGALIAALSLLMGYLVGGNNSLNWLILPMLTIPAVVLPLVAVLALGTRGLPMGSRWQSWSVLGLGMTITPLLLLVLESVVAVIVFIGIVAFVMAQPELASELEALSRQVIILGPQTEEALDLLSPLLTRPEVIITALIYVAVLVPAVEELIKPLGVWLLAGRLDSPAQGFTLGALSGAGYALIETVGVSGQAAEWASLLFSRIGTGLLHITTSALVGAAIVLARRERRYLKLIGTYLLAVLLHGLWNTFAMLFTFSNLADLLEQPGRLSTLQPMLLGVLGILAVALFVILLVCNRKMRGTLPPRPTETIIPAEPIDPTP